MILLALLALLALNLVACGQSSVHVSGWSMVAHLRTGETTGPVRLGGAWAFVPNMSEGTVTQIDRATGKVAATISVADPAVLHKQGCAPDSVHAYDSRSWLQRTCNTPFAIAWDGSSLWALDNGLTRLVRVDLAQHRVTDSITLPGTGWDVAIAGGIAWVSGNDADHSLYEVDLQRRQVIATVGDLDQGTAALAAGTSAVWVICARGAVGHLDRVDPSSGRVVGRYPIDWWSPSVAADGAAVYVRGDNGGEITRLDAATGAVQWTQPGPGFIGTYGLDQLGVSPAGIWLSGPTTARLDRATGHIAETIPIPSASLAVDAGSVWVVQLDGSVSEFKRT